MRLGYVAGYSQATLDLPLDLILEAERLGYDSVWTSEAYGSDAVTPAAWILARTTRIRVGTGIMQMPARTPTCAAMTALTLSALSGGRFILGLGPSGPRVVEGWYGVPYGQAMARTREYVDIVRQVAARQGPLVHHGRHYRIPWDGPDASGLAVPMKSILHGDPELPVYTAAVTPAGLATAAEVADGVIPIWMNPDRDDLVRPHLEAGFARGGSARRPHFDVAPFVQVVLGQDLDHCRSVVKGHLALYVGGMGPRGRNFYADYVARMGYEAQARRVQDLYLAGQKEAAVAAVPDALVDDIALVGPADRIRAGLDRWRDAARAGRVGSLLAAGASAGALRLLAEELL